MHVVYKTLHFKYKFNNIMENVTTVYENLTFDVIMSWSVGRVGSGRVGSVFGPMDISVRSAD